MNLLLIEKKLSDVNQHLLSNVDYITFEFGITTYENLLEQIEQKNNYYTNVGIFSHGNHSYFEFVNFIDNKENLKFKDFLQNLKDKTQFQNLDLFSCFFGNNLGYISDLENLLGINVRASSNITGNQPFGDWIMETDNINIKTVYFNDSISTYNVLLIGLLRSHDIYKLVNFISDTSLLKNQIYASTYSYAVIKNDGTIGYTSSNISTTSGNGNLAPSNLLTDTTDSQFSPVVKVFAASNAFCALRQDGAIIPWGDSSHGGRTDLSLSTSGLEPDTTNPSWSQAEDDKIIYVASASQAFAVLHKNGTRSYWGNISGEKLPTTLNPGTVLTRIFATQNAFCVMDDNNTIVDSWGSSSQGGVNPTPGNSNLSNVKEVIGTNNTFVAIKNDGTVYPWGTHDGTNSSNVPIPSSITDANDLNFSPVTQVVYNYYSIAVLCEDGTVKVWSNSFPLNTGLGETVPNILASTSEPGFVTVSSLYATGQAFAALRSDGSVIAWGYNLGGGSISSLTGTESVPSLSSGVLKIYNSSNGFLALKDNNHIVVWGVVELETNTISAINNLTGTTGYNITKVGASAYGYSVYITDGSDSSTPTKYINITFSHNNYDGQSNNIVATASLNSNSNAFVRYNPSTQKYDVETHNYITSNYSSPSNAYIDVDDIGGYPTADLAELNSTDLENNDSNGMLSYYPEFTYYNNVIPTTSSSTTSSSSSSGDPYINTMKGFRYKLPNVSRIYRCIDAIKNGKRLIVNAGVSNLTKQEVEHLNNTFKHYVGDKKLVTDGFFYDSFFISYGENYAVFDRNINLLETNIDSNNLNSDMEIKIDNKPKDFFCPIQGKSTSTSITINIIGVEIELLKINHPQIINGINCRYNGYNGEVKGIFNDIVNPKNYKIKNLKYVKGISVSDSKQYKKNTKESWMSLENKNTENILV